MRTASISCGRSTGTERLRARRAAHGALAAALLGLALATPTLAAQDAPPRINADPVFPFSNEVEAFAKANESGEPLRDATLFLGSSSIRLWNIHGSFPDIGTVNRGFGGATTPDVLHYYSRLLPRAKPRSVVVYVGENDLAEGDTPEKVANGVLTLLRKLRADYPKAHIAYLSLKPSPLRWQLWPRMAAVNMTVAARSRAMKFDYLDVGRLLLAPDGLPDASLFRQDGLHMNARGYALWTKEVDRYLDRAVLADTGTNGAS
ncbi:GDSL-type esterase/lipase family protein [Sphingobium ummariense]